MSNGHACCLCITPSGEDANGTVVPSGPVDPSEWSFYSSKICHAAAAHKLLQPQRKRKASRLLKLAGKTFLKDNIKMITDGEEEEEEQLPPRKRMRVEEEDGNDEGAGPSTRGEGSEEESCYEMKQMGLSCWFQHKEDDDNVLKSKSCIFFDLNCFFVIFIFFILFLQSLT